MVHHTCFVSTFDWLARLRAQCSCCLSITACCVFKATNYADCNNASFARSAWNESIMGRSCRPACMNHLHKLLLERERATTVFLKMNCIEIYLLQQSYESVFPLTKRMSRNDERIWQHTFSTVFCLGAAWRSFYVLVLPSEETAVGWPRGCFMYCVRTGHTCLAARPVRCGKYVHCPQSNLSHILK